jgi:hypothetical protein
MAGGRRYSSPKTVLPFPLMLNVLVIDLGVDAQFLVMFQMSINGGRERLSTRS